jgi:hypothetical protein
MPAMAIRTDRHVWIAVCKQTFAMCTRYILLVDRPMTPGAACGYPMPWLSRACYIMAAVAVDADRSIPIPGRQRTRMVAVLFRVELFRMTTLALLVVLQLKITVIDRRQLRMREFLISSMTGRAMQRLVNRSR